MEMYQEINNGEDEDGIDEKKQEAQFKYTKQQISTIEETIGTDGKQLHMFEKGRKAVKRAQPVEEESSDEEFEDQLVCNMTGANWESLPYPIIVDSGACASVMPTTWCDHVPLKEKSQSNASELFRATNGQKIHNHGRMCQ